MLLICFCDYWNKCEFYKIYTNHTNSLKNVNDRNHFPKQHDEPITTYELEWLPKCHLKDLSIECKNNNKQKKATLKRLKINIDAITVFYVKREILAFTQLRGILENKSKSCDNGAGCQLLWLEINPPNTQIIDFKWNRMLAHTLWEKIELDNLMWWLSTLGGGFSALGEQFARCAETAGRISIRQMNIGLRLGDPFLQARCKLYYAISLVQTGHLRSAKYLVRQQYQFARQYKEIDGRLVKMCEGIWLRLQYEYSLKLKKRGATLTREAGTTT